jgi:hypothetical protein
MLNRNEKLFVQRPASNGRSGNGSSEEDSSYRCRAARRTARHILGRIGLNSSKLNSRNLSRRSKCTCVSMDGPRLHSLAARKGFLISAEGEGRSRSQGSLIGWPWRMGFRETHRVVASFGSREIFRWPLLVGSNVRWIARPNRPIAGGGNDGPTAEQVGGSIRLAGVNASQACTSRSEFFTRASPGRRCRRYR